MGGGAYVAYTLNLLGPMLSMANAASNQAVEIGKEKLRDFLENNETARQALSMPAKAAGKMGRQSDDDGISMDRLDRSGKRRTGSTTDGTANEDDLDDF